MNTSGARDGNTPSFKLTAQSESSGCMLRALPALPTSFLRCSTLRSISDRMSRDLCGRRGGSGGGGQAPCLCVLIVMLRHSRRLTDTQNCGDLEYPLHPDEYLGEHIVLRWAQVYRLSVVCVLQRLLWPARSQQAARTARFMVCFLPSRSRSVRRPMARQRTGCPSGKLTARRAKAISLRKTGRRGPIRAASLLPRSDRPSRFRCRRSRRRRRRCGCASAGFTPVPGGR